MVKFERTEFKRQDCVVAVYLSQMVAASLLLGRNQDV